MKYNIVSIDDSRKEYKETIRARVKLKEVPIPAVDGKAVDLQAELDKRELFLEGYHPTRGELGVWLSTFDCWQWARDNDEELVVFEDDAIPTAQFNQFLEEFRSELPVNWGFLTLWVPENQYYDYLYDLEYDSTGGWQKVGNDRTGFTSIFNYGAIRLSKVYQGYGNVATLYSPMGASRLINHARTNGISNPIDCWIMDRAHTGVIDGYSPKPHWAKAVRYDWAAETTVHNTERL